MTKKRRHRWFPNKAIADNFRSNLLYRRFADCLPGGIPITIATAADEYLQTYEVRGCAPASKREAKFTLDRFRESFLLPKVSAITQKALDQFIVERLAKVSRYTVNKDIRNLRTFLGWCRRQRYTTQDFTLNKVKVARQIKKALTTDQIQALLAACPSLAWRIRVLLSLTTGLRKNDLDGLPASSVDLKRMTLDTTSQKTGKVFVGRPLPKALKPILKNYMACLDGTGKLFEDVNVRKEWDALRIKANLPDITRQDFRRTFATLMQRVGSIGSAQTLLEHSDSRVTGEFYTDTEMILRWKVNQLPVKEWMKSDRP